METLQNYTMLKKLDGDLNKRIKEIFEPKYGRPISDEEALNIANNLADLIELCIKFKWKQK